MPVNHHISFTFQLEDEGGKQQSNDKGFIVFLTNLFLYVSFILRSQIRNRFF